MEALNQIDRFLGELKGSKLCQVRARAGLKDNIVAPWMFEHFPIANPPLEWELDFDQDELSELSICRSEGFSQLRLTETVLEFSSEFRERFEDDILSALAAAAAGCMGGCGGGNSNSYYFDLCLTDVAKAIDVLREVCQRAKLPNTCWRRA
ncbi:hypothetical protein KBI23_00730 [bacterium]|nr:hypothetical protein [bacterium]MBP9809037.1 hypothetical protein [bacterium]